MNKYDDYIKEFLISNKEVSLDRIGTFSLISPEFKSKKLNADNVKYYYNCNAATTPALIELAAQKLSKNKLLVASDFESYLQQIVQFLNIGKAHTFQGVGSIKKNKQGTYEIVSENSIVPLDTPNSEVLQKPKSDAPSGSGGIKVFALLICLIIFGGLIWGGYQYFSAQKNASKVAISAGDTTLDNALNPSDNLTDTAVNNKPATDTSATILQSAPGENGPAYFRFIYEETVSRLRANTRTQQLKSYGYDARFDSVNNNSVVKKYEMYIRKLTTSADTSLVKDTLQRFFERPVIIKPD